MSSSLLNYASPWTSDSNDNGVSRKRVPTMGGIQNTTARKTVKVRPSNDTSSQQYVVYTPSREEEGEKQEGYSNLENSKQQSTPESIDEHIEKQNERTTKINSILNKITSFNTDDKLGDFNPMPYPTNITKRNSDQIIAADESVDNGINPLMPKSGKPSFELSKDQQKPAYYRASDSGKTEYTSYRSAYGREGLSSPKEPYYSRMGIGNSGDKVMDRLNYMTQMLESIQMEKTNHVTEEFVLYSLLGVFMIYIVDGFSRGGKYVR